MSTPRTASSRDPDTEFIAPANSLRNSATTKDAAKATASTTGRTRSQSPNGDVREVDIGDPSVNVVGMDFIIHNMYADPTDAAFVTFRKWFSDDADAMLARVASHVQQKLYSVISLQLSKHSCVVVCASEKALEEFPEDAFVG